MTQLSSLQARLERVATRPGRWLVLAENVPVWPEPPRLKLPEAGRGPVMDLLYPPSQGTPHLIEALCRREREVQQAPIQPANVLVTAGALDAIGLVVRRAVRAGIHTAVVGAPVLACVHQLLEASGLAVQFSEPADLADLAGSVRRRCLFYLNTPQNPTGDLSPDGLVDELAAGAEAFGHWVVLDATYDSYVFVGPGSGGDALSALASIRNGFTVNSFSKSYGIPGARLGWVVSSPENISELTAQLEWERIAVPARSQDVGCQLLAHGNEALVDRVRQGRATASSALAHAGWPIALPAGGTQLWVELGVDAEPFADWLMEHRRIVLTTGANYSPLATRHIRLPLGIDGTLLASAIERIAESLASYADRSPVAAPLV